MLAAIWAEDKHGLIGIKGKLPWHLPNDLKFFKKMTIHNTVVMGRKTFEGMGKKALPDRQTIVLTNDLDYEAENVLIVHTVEEVLQYAEETEGITFIIGGREIFKAFLPYLDILYKTVIHESFEGDVYFPKIDWSKWAIVSISEGIVDEKNKYVHQFETYQKKQ